MGSTCCRGSFWPGGLGGSGVQGFLPVGGDYREYDETKLPYLGDEPYLTTRRTIVEEAVSRTLLSSVDSLIVVILSYVTPQVVFRYKVLTNNKKYSHDALILWDNGLVECQDCKSFWRINTDWNVSAHALMEPLLEFNGKMVVVSCMGWGLTTSSQQKWIEFEAVTTLPKFKCQISTEGPDIRGLARALDKSKRSFFELHTRVRKRKRK
ncbi:hypothetical protein AAMO2058_000799700 [Amorphochlora amoebiformis]